MTSAGVLWFSVNMPKEKLRKVTSFGDLKIGQITVCTDCAACGAGQCRGLIVKFDPQIMMFKPITKTTHVGPAFLTYPHCTPRAVYGAVEPCAVQEGRVFVVEDGLEDSEAAESEAVTQRKKKVSAS